MLRHSQPTHIKISNMFAIATVLAILIVLTLTLGNVSAKGFENKKQPSLEATSLSKELNIPIEAAESRLKKEKNILKTADKLKVQVEDSIYGGSWISEEGDMRVAVVRTDKTNSVVKEINNTLSENNVDLKAKIVTVKYTENQLHDIRDEVIHLIQDEFSSYSVGIETNRNRVSISVTIDSSGLNDAQSIIVDKLELYGDAVDLEITRGSSNVAACNPPYCDSPLRGGVAMASNSTYSGIDCTSGFSVFGNSGAKYVLTAGHCENPGWGGWATRTSNGTLKKIGPVYKNIAPTHGIDGMIILIRESTYNWDVIGKVLVTNGYGNGGYHGPSYNEEYDINGTDDSSTLIGSRVCSTGANTGSSCGPVKSVGHAVKFGNYMYKLYDLVKAELCVQPGDSGGPVFRLNKALGVITGTTSDPALCSDKYYTDINAILDGFNHTVHIY